jgi:hypothetical protein
MAPSLSLSLFGSTSTYSQDVPSNLFPAVSVILPEDNVTFIRPACGELKPIKT